ncbi:MAG: NAD-dependent succinate-semialdehyde dehydrogenase [Nitrososphaeria archaeon]|nr:NAD-dependent succinate-semialdehyde dehydrogenase [Aigarchaeota archaeon]MCX8187063.1 NAD-dependent succinate-semialdehyde dehydrogenase [Nitrososphaeria archaeon]
MFIDGGWVEASGKEYFGVENPATEEVFAEVSSGGAGEVERAVQAAHRAFREWSESSLDDRRSLLRRAAELVEKRAEEIARYLTMEQGKPFKQSVNEVMNAAYALRYFSEEIFRVYGQVIPLPDREHDSVVIWQPVGVVAAITPWNYPVQLLSWKVGAALAAGCTIVAKPPSYTPISPIKFIECFADAGVPRGVVNVVTGSGRNVGEYLVTHPLVRKVTFTGSTEVGKRIMSLAAQSLKRLTLELGNQTPMIVFDDADIELAVKGAVRRSFRNMGQICNSINRIYVEKSVYDVFLEKFVEEAKKLRIGDPFDPGTDLGPMSSRDSLKKVVEHVEDAVTRGAKVICGGKRPDGELFRKGYWYEPTILADVTHEMKVMREETFGPVVGVMAFESFEQALKWANQTEYGLVAYVYTTSLKIAREAARRLEFGSVGINNVDVTSVEAPYPAWKESGLGHDLGRSGLMQYLETKHIKIHY